MKLRFTVTVDIDPTAWRRHFDTDTLGVAEFKTDVQQYLRTALDNSQASRFDILHITELTPLRTGRGHDRSANRPSSPTEPR